jgi:hypothetical protein
MIIDKEIDDKGGVLSPDEHKQFAQLFYQASPREILDAVLDLFEGDETLMLELQARRRKASEAIQCKCDRAKAMVKAGTLTAKK